MRRVLAIYVVVLLAWGVYRFFYQLSEPLDEFIAKPLIFLGPVFWYLSRYEKNNWRLLGFKSKHMSHGSSIAKDIYLGVGLGMLLGADGLIFNFIKYQGFNFEPVAAAGEFGLFGLMLLSTATAITEETFGRGFLYNFLRYYVPDPKAVLISSLLFLVIHFPIVFFVLKLSGLGLFIYLSTILILSVANSIIFRVTESIYAPILIHLFWAVTMGLYL